MASKEIEAAIQAIADKRGGRVTPDQVLAAAKIKSSPLHSYFAERGCFDPKRSMNEYGVIVARELIRSITVRVTTETYSVAAPQYVRDPKQPADKQGYASLGRLRTNEDVAREAIVAEFARAGAALARAKAVAAALGLENEIEELRVRVSTFATTIGGALAS